MKTCVCGKRSEFYKDDNGKLMAVCDICTIRDMLNSRVGKYIFVYLSGQLFSGKLSILPFDIYQVKSLQFTIDSINIIDGFSDTFTIETGIILD